jgi:hypothetical protein
MPTSSGRPANRKAHSHRTTLNTSECPGVPITTYPLLKKNKKGEQLVAPNLAVVRLGRLAHA